MLDIYKKSLKVIEEIYYQSQYDKDEDLFRIIDLIHSIDDKQIIIDTGSPNKHLPEIMKKMGESNLLINNVEIKKTNLEQVFLKLTKNESITK